jgi:hypothetical protein
VIESPLTITQAAAVTPLTAAATTPSIVPQSLTAAGQPTQTVLTISNAAETIVPTSIRSGFVNSIFVATSSATAAAVAAYHLVDGIFDTGKPPVTAGPAAEFSYSEIWPVEKIRPVRLDLYV